MASIFKTLDGGHLDRALFSSKDEEDENSGPEAAPVPFFLRWQRARRDAKRTGAGNKRTPAPRPKTEK